MKLCTQRILSTVFQQVHHRTVTRGLRGGPLPSRLAVSHSCPRAESAAFTHSVRRSMRRSGSQLIVHFEVRTSKKQNEKVKRRRSEVSATSLSGWAGESWGGLAHSPRTLRSPTQESKNNSFRVSLCCSMKTDGNIRAKINPRSLGALPYAGAYDSLMSR